MVRKKVPAALLCPALLILGGIIFSTDAVPRTGIAIGSRLELMVDDYLVERLSDELGFRLHSPIRRELVFKTDAPWEGNASAYQSVFRDGEVIRMYYRGCHYRHGGAAAEALEDHPWVLCYAESRDGIRWTRPELGLFEFRGSRANNIVLTPEAVAEIGGDPAHTAVFKDANPDCPPGERYKIVILGSRPAGLYALASGDGIHFRLMSRNPLVTEGAFDSQNLAFWDSVRREYREYHRDFRDGIRGIKTAASKSLGIFPSPVWLKYPGAADEPLYTNQIQPYYRAPHIFVGFPMRYTERGWSDPILDLPGRDERLARAKAQSRYGMAVTDAMFMTSRDGVTFKRWPEAFIRPGPRERSSWVYGDNFVFWGMVETPSGIEDAPHEISLYMTDGYWEGTWTGIRRLTLRLDGFVSLNASARGGEMVTKPVVFDGGSLRLNFETSGAGGIQVEIQDPEGAPVPGYALADCPPIPGDRLDHVVRWKGGGGDVRPLSGRAIRLRFVLKDADLYAFRFAPYEPEPARPRPMPK